MKLKLIDKKTEAKGTKSFFFEPESLVNYLPGQYFYFTLPKLNYPDARGETRHFTLSSSPTEGKIIRLTTRIRPESGYKKTLDELKIGTIVEGEGPNGTFIADEKEPGPHVFLAGGIGITPFRSIIRYTVDKKLPTNIYLFYSNSIPEEIAFRKELATIASENTNIKVSLTVTKPEEGLSASAYADKRAGKEKWTGLTGRIDEKLLLKLTSDYRLPTTTFWVVGPPPMVTALEETLEKMNIPQDRIRSEKFTGY